MFAQLTVHYFCCKYHFAVLKAFMNMCIVLFLNDIQLLSLKKYYVVTAVCVTEYTERKTLKCLMSLGL